MQLENSVTWYRDLLRRARLYVNKGNALTGGWKKTKSISSDTYHEFLALGEELRDDVNSLLGKVRAKAMQSDLIELDSILIGYMQDFKQPDKK